MGQQNIFQIYNSLISQSKVHPTGEKESHSLASLIFIPTRLLYPTELAPDQFLVSYMRCIVHDAGEYFVAGITGHSDLPINSP